MQFYKCPFPKATQPRPTTSRQLAAARRAHARDLASIPLFPELAKHPTPEARIQSTSNELAAYFQRLRDTRAHAWRRARSQLRTLPTITRAGVHRYWQSDTWTPREPNYLLDLIWGILHRGENPWRILRIRRQAQLLGQHRLPPSVAQSMRAWD